jgi:hypothetical protein
MRKLRLSLTAILFLCAIRIIIFTSSEDLLEVAEAASVLPEAVLQKNSQLPVRCEGTKLNVKRPTLPDGKVDPLRATLECVDTRPPTGRVEPYAGAPLCPDHDPTTWHGLWDYTRGCHYNHTHNGDPAAVANIFGPAGQLWGQSISYPWETGSGHESHHKHQGYKYAWNTQLKCENDYGYVNPAPHCVRAFRIQYHLLGGVQDAIIPMHSFFAEVQVCTAGGRCGIVRTGGHSNYGIVRAPYGTGPRLPLPSDPPGSENQQVDDEPYRAFNLSEDNAFFATKNACLGCRGSVGGGDNITYWSTDDPLAPKYGSNRLFGSKIWTYDEWGGLDRQNPGQQTFICQDRKCRFNSSEHLVYDVLVNIPRSLDTDGDGFASYKGWTDLTGKIVSTCTVAGPNCVPLVLENVPVGVAAWSTSSNIGYETVTNPGNILGPVEFDLTPPANGVSWIEYPN